MADSHFAGVDDDAVGVTPFRTWTGILQQLQDLRIGHLARDVSGRDAHHVGDVEVDVAFQQKLHTRNLFRNNNFIFWDSFWGLFIYLFCITHLAVQDGHVHGRSSADIRLVHVSTGFLERGQAGDVPSGRSTAQHLTDG